MNEIDIKGKATKKAQSVLVTGAGGFLGGELINQLSKKSNYQMVALTSNKGKLIARFSHLDKFKCFNIEEWESGKLPWNEIDTIIHCAFARVSSGQELADSLFFTNELFTDALENKVPEIINISSQSVYGQINKPFWTERTPAAPDSLYALAKYSSELLTNNIRKISSNRIFTTNIRLSSLIGNNSNNRITTKFVGNALNGEPIRIVGGKQVFSYMDVRDAVAGITALLSLEPLEWHEVYNLGSNVQHSIIELANIVVEVAKRYTESPVKIEIEEKNILIDTGMDSSLLYKDTHWRPQYQMKDTIDSLFKYFNDKK